MYILLLMIKKYLQEVYLMLIAIIRTIILFAVLMASMRIMGKRQLGELEPSELAVTVLISELAANPLQDPGIPLLYGLIPVLTLLCCELLVSGAVVRFIRFRSFLCGKPSIVIEHGTINQTQMRKNRLTIDELFEELRSKGVSDPQTVRYGILETNGSLSILLNEADSPVTPKNSGLKVTEQNYPVIVVNDGRILDANLRVLGKTRKWLEQQMKRQGCKNAKQIYLLTATSEGCILCQRKEQQS